MPGLKTPGYSFSISDHYGVFPYGVGLWHDVWCAGSWVESFVFLFQGFRFRVQFIGMSLGA